MNWNRNQARAVALLLTAGILLLNWWVPLGYAVWLVYILPVMIVAWTDSRRNAYLMTLLCSILIGAGFMVAPQGITPEVALANRAGAIVILWIVARVVTGWKRSESEREAALESLLASQQRLQTANADLQAATKELAEQNDKLFITQQDLQIANEELEVTAEELRLQNDELTDAQEQLQTANQELTAVTIETQVQNEKLLVAQQSLETSNEELKVATEELRQHNEELLIAQQNLETTNEELEVATEELRQQNEELLSAYDELRASEARYRLLFERATDAMIVTDPSGAGQVLSVNPAACRMFGYSEVEFLQLDRAAMIELNDPGLASLLRQRQEHGQAKAELVYKRKDGSRFTGELATTFFMDTGGNRRAVAIIRDVTERKSADEALREREEMLRLALAAGQAGAWSWDLRKGAVQWSDEYYHIFGFDPGSIEPSAKAGMSRIHPDDLLRVEAAVRRAIERGEPIDETHRVVWPDGSMHWVRGISCAFHDGGDQPVRLAGIAMDITEHKRAEEALQQREAILAQAGQMAHLGAWDIEFNDLDNINANPLTWSDEVYRIFGYEPGSVEVTNDLFFEHVHPEDRTRVSEAVAQAMATRRAYSVEHRVVRRDGSERIVQEHAELLTDGQGKPVRMVGAVQDITERKRVEHELRESEERFRTLANNIPQLAWMADGSGSTFWYNQRWFDYTGTTLEEMQDRGWQKVHHPDYVRRVMIKIEQHFISGEVWEDTFPLRGKNGEYRWFLSRAVPIRDESGRVVRWFGTSTDFTEQKRAEDLSRALNQIDAAITSTFSPDEIMQRVLVLSVGALGSTTGGILMREDGVWRPRYRLDLPEDAFPAEMTDQEAPLAAHVARTKQPLQIPDVGKAWWLDGGPIGQDGARAVQAVPLVQRDEVIGVLLFNYADPVEFGAAETDFVQKLAAALALALENARLYGQAHELAVVEERQRLARELHDSVSQMLFAASVIADVLPKIWDMEPAEGRKRLDQLRRLTRGAFGEMRMLLLELRPHILMQTSLPDLIKRLADVASARAGCEIAVDVDGEYALAPDVHVAFYRLAQEALNNVIRHARASQASIALKPVGEGAQLQVTDNGRGFDPEAVSGQHLGLSIMRERAGAIGARLEIASRDGEGTQVTVTWPDGVPQAVGSAQAHRV